MNLPQLPTAYQVMVGRDGFFATFLDGKELISGLLGVSDARFYAWRHHRAVLSSREQIEQ
jgi:hypothetical protein